MAELFQFAKFDDPQHPNCIACESMLADALDETLSPADEVWFDSHLTTCADCARMVSEAQRGAAWLELLKTPRPEPSAALLSRILAETSGELADVASVPAIVPAALPMNVLPFRPRIPFTHIMIEPRLAMTAAMAFFSIALTLNLSGVHIDQFHATDLKPDNIRKAYYQAGARTVRTYDSLRVVRVLESRVDEMRNSNANEQPKEKQDQPRPDGSSRRESPRTPVSALVSTLSEPILVTKEGGLA